MLKGFFQNPGIDEADNYYHSLKAFQLDPNQDFLRLRGRMGLGASMTYAQLFFSHQKRFKRLRRELDLHEGYYNHLNREFDILIVAPPPGLVATKQRESFVRQAMGLATSGGFGLVSQAQLNSDNILIAAKRLLRLVREKQKNGRRLILVSSSFGSSIVRAMLEYATEPELKPLKGWLNFSGVIFGTPLFHTSDKKTFFNKVSIEQRGYSSEQHYFRRPLNVHGIKVVHVLGLQNDQHMTSQQLRSRLTLKAWGPNDGQIPFFPYQRLSQPIIPLMDQGHHIDLSSMSSTFLRCLSAMVSTIPQPNPIPGVGVPLKVL